MWKRTTDSWEAERASGVMERFPAPEDRISGESTGSIDKDDLVPLEVY